MPNKPKIVTLTNTSVDVLNAIRNSASINYQDYVPIATPNAESVREIGNILMDNPTLMNTFLDSLINRIGNVLVTSKLYSNPLAPLKLGIMELGETMEEVFVNLAKPQTFDSDIAEQEIWKKEIPDVKSAFHVTNYKKFYKTTVNESELRQAFLSWQGVSDLISKIVENMYSSASYDEFQVMKYMLAKMITKGMTPIKTIDNLSDVKSIVTAIKATSNEFRFLSNKYNIAKVKNFCNVNDQYLIINSKTDAEIDVNVLASAFNMDKAQFMGHRILIDSFGSIDTDRLDILFDGDSTYTHFDSAALEVLDKIPAVLIDKRFIMCYDNMITTRTDNNGQGLYNQFWLHKWSTFSTSPFANCCVFVGSGDIKTGTIKTLVNGVEATTANMNNGETLQIDTVIETTEVGVTKQQVNFKSNNTDFTVNKSGTVKFKNTKTGTGTQTGIITITLADNPDVTATFTITGKY